MEGKTVVSVVAVGCLLLRAVCVLFGGVAIWYSWVKFLGGFFPLCYNIMGMFVVPVCCLISMIKCTIQLF